MKLKPIAAGASALALSACLLGAAGCPGSTDATDLQGVSSVEGFIDDDVEQSIRNLVSIGADAMNETDRRVVEIMTHCVC